jgi:hypothetical protein
MLPKTKRAKTIVCKIYPQIVGDPCKFNVPKPIEFVTVYITLDDTSKNSIADHKDMHAF